MTDIKPGDYVRSVCEGEVERVTRGSSNRDVVHFRTRDEKTRYAYADECTVIDPPVKVGDEITYEQAIKLPSNSVLLGLVLPNAYQVRDGGLWCGDGPTPARGQRFRVLHIPTEATS